MGEKNKNGKFSKLFNREGFYVVLFVCLCIVAVVAVYISTKGTGNHAQQQVQSKEPSKYTTSVDEGKVSKNQLTQPQKAVATVKQQSTAIHKEKAKNINASDKKRKHSTKKEVKKEGFKLMLPVDGDIVKKFDANNLQESKTLQQWETHEGIDIACDIATEVKAAADGKVISVYYDDKMSNIEKTGLGVTIKIDHGNGIQTVYCNLAEDTKVKKGDTVKKGQVIGIVGDTAVRETSSIEGSHLHFAVLKRNNGQYELVNPNDFIK